MRRYRRELRLPLNDNPNGWSQYENVAASDWPETFDAQMGERASGGLNWEKSMVSMTVHLGFGGGRPLRCNSLWFITGLSQPFSVTLLTDAESNRTSHTVQNGKASKNRGNSARESESEEQNARSPRLRAAVLVAMPSPLHARSHFGHAASGRLDELAIGLIEMPWIQEDHHSLKGNTS
jgi:hypothetical protein